MAEKTARAKVITPIFRVSFPSVFSTAKPMDGQNTQPKYELTMIFEPGKMSPEEKKRYAEMVDILDKAAMEKFKKKVAAFPPNFKRALRDGAEKEHLKGFGAGTVFAKASSYNKPGVVASDGKTPIIDAAGLYPGCYARASVTAYAYDNVSKGVAFGLSNVMFIAEGERLDSQTSPDKDFGEAGLTQEGDDLA